MTTLAAMALRVAGVVTDVVRGQATSADASSITDTLNLVQPNQYWHKGTLWVLSGDHNGKVFPVDGFLDGKLTISSTLAPALAAGALYAVSRGVYPWMQLVFGINTALGECIIIDDDDTIEGDGNTLSFNLPTGVEQVAYIEVEDPSTHERTAKNHWRPLNGVIRFDYGHAPRSSEIVHLMHRIIHPDLFAYNGEISQQVNLEWLRWKAAEYVLYWGVQTYGDAKEYRIEELLNRAMQKLKGLMPVKPLVTVRTAG